MTAFCRESLFLLLISVICVSQRVQAQGFLVFQRTTTTTTAAPATMRPATPRAVSDFVLVNNQPVVGTMAPFITAPPPTAEFLSCFGSCPTTSEYNPVCANNMQMYLNEQKFNCARFCGADIRIVRRGSCEGLFPMTRG